jgi:RNA polymerase sigma factor (sigma-70 family)
MGSETKNLSREEFDLLLSHMDEDRECAGEKYTRIWRELVSLFRRRGCYDAEELADETLNRVARKIAEGERPSNLTAYCYGVAKNVSRQYLKKSEVRNVSVDELPPERRAPISDDETEKLYSCLERCLAKLPDKDAQLLLDYWGVNRRSKLETRKYLAESSSITTTALRIRVHRLRKKLKQCVMECASRS